VNVCLEKNKFICMANPQDPMIIDLKPPKRVAEQAAKGLELQKQFGRGGTEISLAGARQLKNREDISPQTIYRMVSYFARHEADKKGKNFYNKEKPSSGYIAWQLWGGEPGRSWALQIKRRLKVAGLK
jgi:hypothetical protein